jgi:hypothetical protein
MSCLLPGLCGPPLYRFSSSFNSLPRCVLRSSSFPHSIHLPCPCPCQFRLLPAPLFPKVTVGTKEEGLCLIAVDNQRELKNNLFQVFIIVA